MPSVALLSSDRAAADAPPADRPLPPLELVAAPDGDAAPRDGAGAPPPRQAPFAAGDLVAGRWRIVRLLGRGGMGEVYEADDNELHERVALKTLARGCEDDDERIARLRREIQLAHRVTHPNVSRLFDIGFHDTPRGRRVFFTMELLPGEDLAERLRRDGALSTQEALPLVEDMAHGLSALHRAGIVHRDFKSANVMLVAAPDRPPLGLRAVITDLGLAQSVEDGPGRLTQTGQLIGSPAYMAPEQVRGEPTHVATDVYAFGVVLFELLTGGLPFQDVSASRVARKRLWMAAPNLRRRLPRRDRRWSAVIARCLERDVAARYDSIAAVLQALAIAAPPPTTRTRRWAWLVPLFLVSVLLGQQLRLRARWPASASPSARAGRTIAVLPLRNLAQRADADWLSTALAEMLRSELSAGGGLVVLPGEAVAQARAQLPPGARGAFEPLPELQQMLGFQYALEGGYTVLGDVAGLHLRLDLRLRDPKSGAILAAQSVTATDGDLFAVVARAGVALRARLDLPALPLADGVRAAQASLPAQPEARRLYAEGLADARRYQPVLASAAFVRALQLAPADPLLHRALAESAAELGHRLQASSEARRAFELAASLPADERTEIEAYYRLQSNDLVKAIALYQKLLLAAPDDVLRRVRLVLCLSQAHRWDDAFGVLAAGRSLPAPAGRDPALDLTEAKLALARGEVARSLAAARRVVDEGRARRYPLLQARGLLRVGMALEAQGDHAGALRAAQQALPIYQASGDRASLARTLNLVGMAQSGLGHLDQERDAYLAELNIAREVGDVRAQSVGLNNLTHVDRLRGNGAAAVRRYLEAAALSHQEHDGDSEAIALNNASATLFAAGQLRRATALDDQAIALAEQSGSRRGEAFARAGRADLLFFSGRTREAIAESERSLQALKAAGTTENQGSLLRARAQYQRQAGELEAAGKTLEACLVLDADEASAGHAQCLSGVAALALVKDELAAASAANAQASAVAGARAHEKESGWGDLQRAELGLAQGDLAPSVDWAGRSGERLEAAHEVLEAIGARLIEAQAARQLRQLDRAQAAQRRAERLLGARAIPLLRIAVAEERALLDAALGRSERARAHLTRLAREAQSLSNVELQLDLDLARGVVALDRGDRAAGAQLLRRVRARAQQHGFLLTARLAAERRR